MVIAEPKRLILREFVPEDIDGLYTIYEGNQMFVPPLSQDRDEEKMKLESYIHYVYGFYGFGLWAVVEKATGTLIGRCGLSVEDIDNHVELELGYMIGRSWQKKGYGLESVRAVLDYAAEEICEKRIAVRIDAENEASAALAKAAGFVRKGTTVFEGKTMDLYFYDIK